MSGLKITHYQILGVATNVSPAEIKRAYRKLVKCLHPDIEHSRMSNAEANLATERMMQINEAYETLKDRSTRTKYDISLGLNRGNRIFVHVQSMFKQDEGRERFLNQTFHPARLSIVRVLNMYQRQMSLLSLDIYDEKQVASFERYVDKYENCLRKGSQVLCQNHCPPSLDAAVQMLRYCIAQAADGLEEMRRFCLNFDYNHLTTAASLVAIAQDLSRQALRLTRY